MTLEEKRAWITLVVSVVAYATYLAIILGMMSDTPVQDVPYVSALLWTVGVSIVATIAIGILVAIPGGIKESIRKDQRDREIGRFGEYVGQSFVAIGCMAALIMAMLELDHFWIANAIYLCFTLSAILGSVAKIASYRFGFQPW